MRPRPQSNISRSLRSQSCLATAILLAAILPPQTASAAPPQNFLPVGPASRISQTYWDSASLVRTGDRVSFDGLSVRVVHMFGPSGAQAQGSLEGELTHYTVSCGLRILHEDRAQTRYGADGAPQSPLRRDGDLDQILGPEANLLPVIAAACAGDPAPSRTGFASIKAIMDAAKTQLDLGPSALPINPRQAPQTPPAWATQAHRFIRTAAGDADDAQVFLDSASSIHRGDRAEALVLVVLNRQHPWSSGAATVVLRRVEADCRRRTLHIAAQAIWSRFGEFQESQDAPFGSPKLKGSASIDSQVEAACGPPSQGDLPQSYVSIDDAVAWARHEAHKEEAGLGPTCFWAQAGAINQKGYLAAFWEAWPDQRPLFKPEFIAPLLAACHVPPEGSRKALDAINAYAAQRGALQVLENLSHKAVDEAAIQQAWSGLSRADRGRYAQTFEGYTQADLRWRLDLIASLAGRLGLGASNTTAATQRALDSYLSDQVKLEDD